ncbi:hypothetical protein K525DRAFT_272672 [Schizophyllum commune Loenen D]|nr:hypothetical protein K525DRAFT_272672 [Schizophyllum commune Loenen D]
MSERGASEGAHCTEAAVHASVAPDTLHDAPADHEEPCPDPSMSSAASVSSQEAPSTELDTSMYMKILHPSHALIPKPPAFTNYCYYGWPLSIWRLKGALLRMCRSYNVDGVPIARMVPEMTFMVEKKLGFRYPLRTAFVKAGKDDKNLPLKLYPTAPGISFLFLVGTCGKPFEDQRPTQEQMRILADKWFGVPP